MSRSKKNIKIHNQSRSECRNLKERKMKPYCLTGDKRNSPAVIFTTSYEDYDNVWDAKKEREDIKIEKKVEKHRTRQQSKTKIRKELNDLM